MDLESYLTPAIVVLAYCTCYLFNVGTNGKLKRFIPIIAAVVGVIASFALDFPATSADIVNSVTTGMVSGLASTGIWEGYKNIVKKGGNQ